MDPSRRNDTMTLMLVAILVVPILFATGLASCDAREARRAEAALVAEAKAKAAAAAVASARFADDVQREQLRQRLVIETLEQRAAVQHQSFEDYKALTVYGLALLGGLIALVGILFPVMTHLTAIVPGQRLADDARQAVKDARDAVDQLDSRFEDLTTVHRQRELEQAIASLLSPDAAERGVALQHLLLNSRNALTEKQIFDIALAARKSEDAMRLQLASLLTTYDSPYATSLLEAALEGDKSESFLGPVFRHCELIGAPTLRQKLRAWALAHEGQTGLLLVMHMALTSARSVFDDLANDEEWLSKFRLLKRLNALQSLLGAHFADKKDIVEQTALFRGAQGKHVFFSKLASAGLEEVRPEEADCLRLFEDGRSAGVVLAHQKEFRERKQSALAEKEGKA